MREQGSPRKPSTRRTRSTAVKTSVTTTPATKAPAKRTTTRTRPRVTKRPVPVAGPMLGTDAQVLPPVAAPSTEPQAVDVAPAAPTEESFVIPPGYSDTRISLLVKDPWWSYAYWEVSVEVVRDAERRLPPGEGWRPALRAYDVTDSPTGPARGSRSFDVVVPGFLGNWFLHTDAPSRSFVVDVGFLSLGGDFVPVARSNRITSPRLGPSEVVDEEWTSSEETYWKLFGATAGVGLGSSPMEVRAVLERQLSSGLLSSPGLGISEVSSPSRAPKERSFYLRVWTELIVHGATDPRAIVTLQGRPVDLLPDGTFSCRFALPDGTQVIPVEAVSPDGVETRRITPTVSRQTTEETRS